MIRFGEQGAKTNQNSKQRKAFKDRHRKNINKGKVICSILGRQSKMESSRRRSN